jgi:HAD superfamily hydrolase (TIGR01509 family)
MFSGYIYDVEGTLVDSVPQNLRSLQEALDEAGIDEFIGATACGDDVEHGKPDPRIVGVALRKLGLTGPEAVMIGDTPYDAEAASGAGTAAAGVLTG